MKKNKKIDKNNSLAWKRKFEIFYWLNFFTFNSIC